VTFNRFAGRSLAMPASTRPAIDPDALRRRFRDARRVPQLLEVQDACRVAMRQVSDMMDDDDDNGDGNNGNRNGNGGDGLHELWEQLSHLVTEIGDRLTRQAKLDDLERRAQGRPVDDRVDFRRAAPSSRCSAPRRTRSDCTASTPPARSRFSRSSSAAPAAVRSPATW
jgi:hypothetical protein